MHYIRTFFKALQLTLRGEAIQPPKTPYPKLQNWLTIAQERLNTVYDVAEKSNLDEATRKAIVLQLDGRSWSMDLILSSVKFHLETEYPSLMNSTIEHNLTTLYALHFDDKYRVSQLAQSEQVPELIRPAIQNFAAHFLNIPPSNEP